MSKRNYTAHRGVVQNSHCSVTVVEEGSGRSSAIRLAVHGTSRTIGDPALAVSRRIDEALDPTRASSKAKTFATMTEAEREEMRRLYEKKS